MKTDNNYLRTIATKLGVETMANKPKNYYLRKIFEKLGGSGEHHSSDNHYLKYISENIDGGSSPDITIDWSINDIAYMRITSLIIPDEITSLPNAFATNLTNLQSVTLPSTLKTINSASFQLCTQLTELNIPQSVTTIGYNAFPNPPTSKLEKVILNWTGTIPVHYDDNHTQLPNNNKAVFSIPKGTKSIYESANYPSEKLVERED